MRQHLNVNNVSVADSVEIRNKPLTSSVTYFQDWPVRTLSFSYDGKLLASASEDLFIDIGHVETGEKSNALLCTSQKESTRKDKKEKPDLAKCPNKFGMFRSMSCILRFCLVQRTLTYFVLGSITVLLTSWLTGLDAT